MNSNLLLLLLPLPIYKDAFETCSRSFTNVYAYFTGDVLELIQWYVPLLLSPLPILLGRLWNIQQYDPLLLFLPIFLGEFVEHTIVRSFTIILLPVVRLWNMQ